MRATESVILPEQTDMERARIAEMQALSAGEVEAMRALGFWADDDRFRNERDVTVRWSPPFGMWKLSADAFRDDSFGVSPTHAVEQAKEEAEGAIERARLVLAAIAGPPSPVSPTHAPITLGVEESHPPSDHEVKP